MAGDDGAMIAVAMMACFFSAVMSAGLGYTCTGGSFDPDDFDTDKCLKLPDDETDDGGGGGGGGGGGAADPTNFPSSNVLACSGYIHEDVTKTCYDVNLGEAGVRWEWLDSDEANLCKGYTTKYGIVVSSSKENHALKYRFPDIMGKDMNAFKFNSAPAGFLTGQNVKFYITPMNDLNERIGNTFIATLDTNNSSEICNAHGNPVSFTSATLVETKASEEVRVDCSGGTWSAWGPCLMNNTNITNDQICKSGVQTRTLSGYEAATGGGTCNVEESQTCRSVGCTTTTEPDQDCVLGEWDSQMASASLEIPLYYDKFTGANTCSAACNGPANSYPGANPGGGIRVETRDIKFEQKGVNGAACGDMRRTPACNTDRCPKDCVGAWRDTPNFPEYEVRCGKSGDWTIKAGYKQQYFHVSEDEINGGQCVNRNATQHVRSYIKKGRMLGKIYQSDFLNTLPSPDQASYCPQNSAGTVYGTG